MCPGWDMCCFTNMSQIFEGSDDFNGDVSSWKTSSLTGINYIFKKVTSSNRNVLTLDAFSVTNMTMIHQCASASGVDTTSWNVPQGKVGVCKC